MFLFFGGIFTAQVHPESRMLCHITDRQHVEMVAYIPPAGQEVPQRQGLFGVHTVALMLSELSMLSTWTVEEVDGGALRRHLDPSPCFANELIGLFVVK